MNRSTKKSLSGRLVSTCQKRFSFTYKYKEELRARWGNYHDVYRSQSISAKLFELTYSANKSADRASDASINLPSQSTANNDNYVDDATWRDLDMDKLFAQLDNTITVLGQQHLYRQLRSYNTDTEQLADQFKTARHFQSDNELREQTQLHLMGLRGSNASQLSTMLYGVSSDGEFPQLLALILSVTSVVTIVIALFMPTLFWLPLLPLLINFVFSETYADNIGRRTLSFGYLKTMLLVAKRLPDVGAVTPINQIEYLRDTQERARFLHSKFRFAGLDSTSGNIAIAQVAFLLNLVCLFDYLVYMRANKWMLQQKEELSSIFETLASIDSAIAVASYMEANPDYCNPSFNTSGSINLDAVIHPLIDNAVPNDFCSDNQSALITGSNMAGKSTFIKTIGCNLILAQTLWLCHARSATVPLAPILSSIKHSDSIEDGKSYYFAEIEALLRLVNAANSNVSHVFLIDEILRGTNTVERVASSAAILRHLDNNNTVLVTSHDVELTSLLPNSFSLLHFSETTDLENMFDYKVQHGPCNSRNAIALLDAIGFPKHVISAAKENASKLGAGKNSKSA